VIADTINTDNCILAGEQVAEDIVWFDSVLGHVNRNGSFRDVLSVDRNWLRRFRIVQKMIDASFDIFKQRCFNVYIAKKQHTLTAIQI